MKEYIIPEIKLSHFESENVLTHASGTEQTAVEQAKAAAKTIEVAKKTFTVTF